MSDATDDGILNERPIDRLRKLHRETMLEMTIEQLRRSGARVELHERDGIYHCRIDFTTYGLGTPD